MILLKTFNDHNNFDNVIVPLSLKIDKLIYVYHHDIENNVFDRCLKVIKKYKDIDVYFKKVTKEDIKSLFNDDVIVDVSANKYLSLVLCEEALKHNNRIIYFDDKEKCIKDYRIHKTIVTKLFNLEIEDIITLNGGKITSRMHQPVKNRNTVELIYKAISSNKDNYNGFINYVSKINSIVSKDIDTSQYILNKEDVLKITNDDNYNRFKTLNLIKIENNTLSFYNDEIRKMFMVSGSFLENYIYYKLLDSRLFNDVMMSCNIDFSRNEKLTVRCELDCLAIKDNSLLFISIKSNKVDTNDLNEIKVHNIMFGNEYSKPVICIHNDLSENRPSIYAKGEELGIYIIEKDDFEKDIAERFLEIINNSYKYNNIR